MYHRFFLGHSDSPTTFSKINKDSPKDVEVGFDLFLWHQGGGFQVHLFDGGNSRRRVTRE